MSFATSATDALNLVAAGVEPERGRITASELEHPSGLLSAAVQGRRGLDARVLPADTEATWVERAAEARRDSDVLVGQSWLGVPDVRR